MLFLTANMQEMFPNKIYIYKICITTAIYYSIQKKKMFSQKTDDQVQYLYKDVLIIIYYLTFVQILFVVFYI